MVRFAIRTCLLCFTLLFLLQQQASADSRVVINKGTNQLAFFEDGYILDVFPVATGRQPHFTPEGNWQVIVKLAYPSWRNPDGGPVIPGGAPENPLGPRWLGLNALGTGGASYGVHGTNDPDSIGTHASSGCIRMYNDDIFWLYERVPVGTEVEIISSDEDLYAWKKYSRVTINDMEIEFGPHLGPVQAGETTYLPIRPLAAALGYRLQWNDPDNSLLLSNIEREVLLTLGSNHVLVNNIVFTAPEAPFLLEDSTFVPVWLLQDYLGVEVFYETESRTISLKAPADPTEGRLAKHHLAVQLDGKIINFPEDLTPLNDGENLLVPIRPICAALGAAVNWNGATQSVEIRTLGKRALIPVNGLPAWINGAVIETPVNIFVKEGSSYIDLNFLAEIFGFRTYEDVQNRILKITTI